MKIAVLFPGIGYTCDKPLLYYGGKLAREAGYEVRPVPYGNFPRGVKGDAGKMRQAFLSACDQAEALLADVDWDRCAEIVFIGKSIGTAVGTRYAQEKGLPARHVLLTPLEETFRFDIGEAVAFHGTADPWAATPAITALCRERRIPLFLTEGANHSLETGDVAKDLETLLQTMDVLAGFLRGGRIRGDAGR